MHLAAARAVPILMKDDSTSAAICKCTLRLVVTSFCRIQRSSYSQTWDLEVTLCHGVALVVITGLTGNYCGYLLYDAYKGFRSLLIEVGLL